jgi:hypothetical protein
VAGGGWRVAGGGWRVAAAEIITSVDISLNLIFSVATATRSHEASRSWC